MTSDYKICICRISGSEKRYINTNTYSFTTISIRFSLSFYDLACNRNNRFNSSRAHENLNSLNVLSKNKINILKKESFPGNL